MPLRAINPVTEDLIAEYPEHTDAETERLLRDAGSAFDEWKRTPFPVRANVLRAVATLLRERRATLAELMTREMGKPIAAAESEIDKCATACDYFAEHGPRLLRAEERPSDAARSYVRFDPLGPVLAIMPWNFPFWQLFRFAAPALMAGNVALLKHAPNVPGCAKAIEEVFLAANCPPGVFTSLMIADNARAEALIAHPAVRAVTLTGSERAGMAVGAAAGKVIKKAVLELGGSDPFLVLADADVEAVAKAAASARCINTGQSCIAAKRFLVDARIAPAFEEALVRAMAALKVGDPMDRQNDLGPLARLDLVEHLHDQVQRSVGAGARLLTGGRRREGKGFFYEPTVLADVRPGMAAFDEETFGPVAAVTRCANTNQMVELANRSRYGLGASVWSRDPRIAETLVARLDAGCVFVNGAVKSDPRLPFGGVKNSGYGRELSEEGIREFTNIKAVWIGDVPWANPAKRAE